MKPEFTTGPWKWRFEHGHNYLSPGVLATDQNDGTPRGDQLDRANARLIAAAPDMYAALEACPLPPTMGTAEEHYRRFYDWHRNVVEPALKKAGG